MPHLLYSVLSSDIKDKNQNYGRNVPFPSSFFVPEALDSSSVGWSAVAAPQQKNRFLSLCAYILIISGGAP